MESLMRLVRSFAGRNQECFYFQRTMAKALGCSVRTVQRAIAALKGEKRLAVDMRGPTSAVYRAIQDEQQQQLCLNFSADPGGPSGVASEPPPYMNPFESIRKWRREVFTPTVVFLRPQAPRKPPKLDREAFIGKIAAMIRGEL
jgi:hypothetical protein